ncbi:SulP family inorganic anion transporter [Haloferula rosea]|uniref:SulP family inorganic anion transporter n=1 Tax=Haloferula rosea TaxID=490093 RepID=A0A934VGV1_9BACT|nr:SulP family inorganic anion transporter [Haloferula rosea]MBK1828422.1 SulP family inorganic anion transporter [Haloferula rosea]
MRFSPKSNPVMRGLRRFFGEDSVDFKVLVGPIKRYNKAKFRADMGAAPNVALLAVPQGMAYAAIAELPIAFGIICSAVAAIVAPIFAGSRHTILGPTNATAFMLFSFFAAEQALRVREIELIPLLVLLVGVFCLIGGLLKVADLLQYVSRSVLVGYVSGAAVLIMANQCKHIFGVSAEVNAQTPSNFITLVIALFSSLGATQWQPLVIGGSTVALYYLLRKWKPGWPVFAISLVTSSAIFGPMIHRQGLFHGLDTFTTFKLAELVPHVPDFTSSQIFSDIGALIGVAFAVAFLACLENSVMAKSLASQSGDRAEVNQDMFAVGAANVACAFTGGMPASGSLTRSMLNYNSGAFTRFSSLYAGIIILIAALLIAWLPAVGLPLIDFVPKAALAALVVAIALSLISPQNIRVCLRSTPDDAAVVICTFAATLIAPLHVAIFIGVGISITLFLRKASRPHLVEYEFSDRGELREIGEKRKRPNPAISIVHVEGDLFFGAAELFRNQVQRTAADPSLKILILRLKNARHLDATSVLALEELIKFMRNDGRHVLISGAPRDVYRVLKNSGTLSLIQADADREAGESNIFLNRPSNPNISTRDALKRAQQLLGGQQADIRIFYDPNKS